MEGRKLLRLFKNASDAYWANVLTQISHPDLSKPFEQQAHEPPTFLTGMFRGSEGKVVDARKRSSCHCNLC